MAQYGFVPAGGNPADRIGFEVPERWVLSSHQLASSLEARGLSAVGLTSLTHTLLSDVPVSTLFNAIDSVTAITM
jgi:hypothetical protein